MQLNDILEENSIKSISQKTNIPEDNLETLFANKFEDLQRVKALGFISIIEREYGAELKVLHTAAKAYYDEFEEVKRITLDTTSISEKKGKSKLLFMAVLLLLGYATWYFLTQFDKKHFEGLLEFIDQDETTVIVEKVSKPEKSVEDLTLVSAVEETTMAEVNDTKVEENTSTLQEAIQDVQALDIVETDDNY